MRPPLELSIVVHNHCWQEARASPFVIFVYCYEHVFHPRLTYYLAEQKRASVTFVPTLGFQMITALFPEGRASRHNAYHGVPERNYSKPCVFDPTGIVETNFAAACIVHRRLAVCHFRRVMR